MKLRQSELRAGHDDFREAAMTIPLVRIEQRADSRLYADLYFFIFNASSALEFVSQLFSNTRVSLPWRSFNLVRMSHR